MIFVHIKAYIEYAWINLGKIINKYSVSVYWIFYILRTKHMLILKYTNILIDNEINTGQLDDNRQMTVKTANHLIAVM